MIQLESRLRVIPAKYLLLGCFLISFSCKNESSVPIKITPAFYHWQTNLDLSQTEKEYLKQLNVQKIYTKFFDVDWNFNQKNATALATLELTSDFPSHFEVVPTIFITNRTFIQIPSTQIDGLVENIYQKLKRQIAQFEHQTIREIQFDCDWTQSTKASYFLLLKKLEERWGLEGIELSATIRLHQIKYVKKTGIPPVKKGMLMYYNMGKVQDITTVNSILDNKIGASYLEQLRDYPLPLDFALPLFQWGVLFRDGELIKLINQLTETALADTKRFTKLTTNTWEVHKSTYLNGYYLYEKDRIRLEKVAYSELMHAAKLLKKQANKKDRTVVFYHLDEAVIKSFEVSELNKIIALF